MAWEYYVGPNKLVHYNQAKERTNDFQPQYNDLNDLKDSNDSNDSNDLTSFTSNLYLSNHRKVVDILLSFTKKIGYDLTNYNLNAIAIQDDPLKVLEDSFSKINVLNNNLPNEANPCFHTIPQHVVQKSVTCNPSLNVAGQLVPSIEHISNIHPLANALQQPPTSNTSKSFVHTLNPPDIVSQTLSNPPTIVTQAPSYTPTIVTQAPSNPPAIVTQTPSNLQEIVTQTLSNHPDNVIVPMLSPIKIQNNKQIIPRSPKHDSPQKPKKKVKIFKKGTISQ